VLQSEDTRKITHGALHRVETFNNDENLLPGAVSAGLALRDSLTHNTLKVGHIVMLEGLNDSTRETSTDTDRSVVELIRDNKTTLGDDGGERARVCNVTHREDHRSGLSNKVGNLALNLQSKIRGTRSTPRAAEADAVPLNTLLHSVSTGTLRLGKTKVVV
jgi:hypothetical protein